MTLLDTEQGMGLCCLPEAACPQGCMAEWGGHAPPHPAACCWAAFKVMQTARHGEGTSAVLRRVCV